MCDPQMTSEDDRDEEGVYQGDRRGWIELLLLRVPNKKRENGRDQPQELLTHAAPSARSQAVC